MVREEIEQRGAAAGRLFSYPEATSLNYAGQPPYPHIVLNDCWTPSVLTECKSQVSAFGAWDGEKDFFGAQKK